MVKPLTWSLSGNSNLNRFVLWLTVSTFDSFRSRKPFLTPPSFFALMPSQSSKSLSNGVTRPPSSAALGAARLSESVADSAASVVMGRASMVRRTLADGLPAGIRRYQALPT